MATSGKSRSTFEYVIGISTIIACVAAVLVVPEVRQWAGLDQIEATATPTQTLTIAPEVISVQFEGKDNYRQNYGDQTSPECKNEDVNFPSYRDFQAVYSFLIRNGDVSQSHYIDSIKVSFKVDPLYDEPYSITIPDRKFTSIFENGQEHMRVSGYFYDLFSYGFTPCFPNDEAKMPYELQSVSQPYIAGNLKIGLLFDYLGTIANEVWTMEYSIKDEVFEFHFSDGSAKVIDLSGTK